MKVADLRVRITGEEKDKIADFCRKNKITKSEYIRNLIDQSDKKTVRIITGIERELFDDIHYELQKVGTNINQIAYFFNLQHLKNLDKENRSLEDLILLDKMKKEQLEVMQNSLNILSKEVANLSDKFEEYHDK